MRPARTAERDVLAGATSARILIDLPSAVLESYEAEVGLHFPALSPDAIAGEEGEAPER